MKLFHQHQTRDSWIRGVLAGTMAALIFGLATPLLAQEVGTEAGPSGGESAKPQDVEPKARYRDSRDLPADELLRAEFKRRYPDIDIDKTHNVTDIQNPTEEEDRHAYTSRMTKVIDLWIASGNGAALSKILDDQAETKDRQPVFLTLHGYFFLHWPSADSVASTASADQRLTAAVAVAPDFAIANTLLAMFQLKVFRLGKVGESERLVNAALAKRPGYVEAALIKCTILNYAGKGEELKAFAKKFCEQPGMSALELDTFLGYFVRAELNVATARTYLNGLLGTYAAKEHRAMVMRHLAALLLRESKFVDARSMADEAVALLDPAKHGDLVIFLRLSVTEDSFKAEYVAANEAKNPEKAKAADAGREKVLLEAMEFDLKYLGPTDDAKGAVLEHIEDFLAPRLRDQENLDLLVRYDREAKLLTRSMREKIRIQIENIEIVIGRGLPLQRYREWAKSADPADHARLADRELATVLQLHAANSQYRLDNPESFALFIELIAHSHRGVSRRAMKLAGISALQTDPKDATAEAKAEAKANAIAQALAATSARLVNEKTLADLEVRTLVQDGLNMLLSTGGRDGAVLVANWIGGLGDAMAVNAVRSEARSFAEKAVDTAGMKTNRVLRDGASDMRTGADAAAWAKQFAEKVAEAKAAEAPAKPPAEGDGKGK